jgi:enediyne biosynthesis protein E5
MPTKKIDFRFEALWRFALAITILNVLGHTLFGFEQSWAQPLVSLATAYSLEFLLEFVEARAHRRPLRWRGGLHNFLSFILPVQITGLAVAMLLYANDRLWPIAFASAVAIGSKYVFRVPVGKTTRHFFNPSNFGISVALLVFPWVGIAPPYQFTENLLGWERWLLPLIIVGTGSFLNARFTKKVPLILAWLGGFAAQAALRNVLFGTPVTAGLVPMTGLAYVLFTFYMITDPGTTPFVRRNQVIFGLSVAAVYGVLMMLHVVFGLFFSLTIVCAARGLGLYVQSLAARRLPTPAPRAPVAPDVTLSAAAGSQEP